MDQTQLSNRVAELKAQLAAASQQIDALAAQAAALGHAAPVADAASHGNFFITGLTVFVLACFVGYYVVWRVTPALHSPLMAVTNAVSSVIIVGALIAAGPAGFGFSKIMGFLAVILASVNIFGGFLVTQRMLSMFKKKGK
ncbi:MULTISPECIES: NAD(P) transhydrogenase subunit alpha [Azospirillum]|uniref:proton-translocating NAD(P)(+) transhydrogenase n=6 Tax=Azospirillum TaxID=191 RepID=A0A0P0EWW5_AZOBR|nr:MULTISPECIES: NAD(P) transhydrogenase subunit alpha [Azospirillum]ALJ34896.1 NAD(P) transhydrogenase subunit alpha part 2 [Azospirillum brasilense]AWJ90230.1 NAD(P) transhydrogenase subunit alpha part 2 [Azospirillum baldaniorum]KAA0675711.1 NAD(P) transhydrogenase subunit alpha [Azospirillum brasilense]MBB3268034.1 NAD(P) transhydrogenase subunit alpha [Azospirillum sp. OGB3]MBY3752605.1 NAD(P) transhydrogenase subunit alpha [Azospirillum formosense]